MRAEGLGSVCLSDCPCSSDSPPNRTEGYVANRGESDSGAQTPQDHVPSGSTAVAWPVHCWVASLESMVAITLAMVFMVVPFAGGGSCLDWFGLAEAGVPGEGVSL